MSKKKAPAQQMKLVIGEQVITYSLTFATRKTLGITVRPDQSISVRAPLESDVATVEEIVHKHAKWILRQQQNYAQLPPKEPAHAFESGASLRFLGRPLLLKIEEITGDKPTREQVTLDRSTLRVHVKAPYATKRVQTLVDKWYREQADLIFTRQLLRQLAHFARYPIEMPELAIRRMKARWGSCSANGKITLNLKLIHLDTSLIDYVIVHELCHLIEHNHSKRFYALLDQMLPDWRDRRQRLNTNQVSE